MCVHVSVCVACEFYRSMASAPSDPNPEWEIREGEEEIEDDKDGEVDRTLNLRTFRKPTSDPFVSPWAKMATEEARHFGITI